MHYLFLVLVVYFKLRKSCFSHFISLSISDQLYINLLLFRISISFEGGGEGKGGRKEGEERKRIEKILKAFGMDSGIWGRDMGKTVYKIHCHLQADRVFSNKSRRNGKEGGNGKKGGKEGGKEGRREGGKEEG